MPENKNNTISTKFILLERMKKLAERQEELLMRGAEGVFISLLAQRRHLERRIDQQNQIYKKNMERISRLLDKKSEALTARVSEVIASIQETDRKIEEMILKHKNGLMREIKDMRDGKKDVQGNGRGKSVFPPRFIDQHK